MKRARKAPDVPLAILKFKDLVRVDEHMAARRLVNLKIPADILIRVHHLARKLNVTKRAATIALLNEGLAEAHKRGVGLKK